MILRTCVVIPTYNNLRTISEVVKDVVLHTPYPILILDDGSDAPVSNSLYSWDVRKALEERRIRVVRFEKNQGKGAALQFAIRDLVARGFTHMVTMDGDGEHLASEVRQLVDEARRHPWDLVLGSRKIKSITQTIFKRLGRALSNFWVKYQTGLRMQDSRSGFRVYPLFHVQNMEFFTRRYDFEIEVLIRLLWKEIGVREREVHVQQIPRTDRVSHFHKFWDGIRLGMLNASLVVISLLRSHRRAGALARAVALGVFIGCTPFFGFQTLLVIFTAFFLRMNMIGLFVGSLISGPWASKQMAVISIHIGTKYFQLPDQMAGSLKHFAQWFAGSMVLGAALAVAAGVVSYLFFKIFEWQLRRGEKAQGQWWLTSMGLWTLKQVLSRIGWREGRLLIYLMVPYLYLFDSRARKGLSEYEQIQNPNEKFWPLQKRVLRHLYRYGEVVVDEIYQSQHAESMFGVRSFGSENLQAVLQKDGGFISLGAHVGGWDVVASSVGLSEACRDGRAVAMNGDRTDFGCELIPFLGRLAPFSTSAFEHAANSKKPLLFTFGFKAKELNYDFYARGPRLYSFDPNTPRELQIFTWTEEYVEALEEYVRQYPDQWFNLYCFWSRPPASARLQGQHVLLGEKAGESVLLEPRQAEKKIPTVSI